MRSIVVWLFSFILITGGPLFHLLGQDTWYGIESEAWVRVRPEQLPSFLGDLSAHYRNRHGRNAISFAAEHATDPVVIDALAAETEAVNQPDFGGRPPLYYAVHNNPTIAVTQRLLELGADPNIRVPGAHSSQTRPLIHALVSTGHADNLNAVLEDPRFVLNPNDCAPIITLAADHLRDAAIYGTLLNHCSNLSTDVLDESLYRAVAIDSHAEVVRLLVARGARPQAVPQLSGRDRTPFDLAIENGSALVSILIDLGVDVNIPTRKWSTESTPLWRAVNAGSRDIVRRLIEEGADIEKGQTAVHSPSRVQVIVTPLMAAAERDSIEIVQMLIAAGANISAINHAGANALMFAMRYAKDPAVTRTFLDADPSVNARMHNDGPSVLMWAAFEATPETILALLDAGADPLVVSNHLTAWDIVQSNHRTIETTAYARLDTGAIPRTIDGERFWSPYPGGLDVFGK